jgi:sRNA-binding regulator protein Hfq
VIELTTKEIIPPDVVTKSEKKDKPPKRIVIDGGAWDRSDTERYHLQQYKIQQEEKGNPVILKFVLRDGKTVAGRLVELGTYVYVIEAKVSEQVRRVMISKHAIDYVILGEGTP